jgi:hypothetical protein
MVSGVPERTEEGHWSMSGPVTHRTFASPQAAQMRAMNATRIEYEPTPRNACRLEYFGAGEGNLGTLFGAVKLGGLQIRYFCLT